MGILNQFKSCQQCKGQRFQIINTCSLQKESGLEVSPQKEYMCIKCKTILKEGVKSE